MSVDHITDEHIIWQGSYAGPLIGDLSRKGPDSDSDSDLVLGGFVVRDIIVPVDDLATACVS